jgi:alkyl sulfatase BDS1-like metallo-beta-lactamase superfamily hydrolase
MGKVRDFAERMWNQSDEFTGEVHPLAVFAGIEEIADGVGFVSSFANVTAIDTADGLFLVDTGGFLFARVIFEQVRSFSTRPVRTAVFTHGHIDHVFGLGQFEREAADNGWPRIHVIAHELVPARFDRYVLTAGYNGIINSRQFRTPGLSWPTEYRQPDQTYRDQLTVSAGDLTVELYHDRGETDDATWAWIPDRKMLCTGDLFIWAAPNCGNPQKVQRYPLDWARALRKMQTLGAELLLPGHGPPILGADRVSQALSDTAQLLSVIHNQTLGMMNDGARLNDILHSLVLPADLLARPYLRPVYDDPTFIVHNIWRLYGGWYDGNPAHLKPAPERAVARELAQLSGGASALARRAAAVADAGDLAVACHLVEFAHQADPDDAEVAATRRRLYLRRADAETSFMAKSIFRAAADE